MASGAAAATRPCWFGFSGEQEGRRDVSVGKHVSQVTGHQAVDRRAVVAMTVGHGRDGMECGRADRLCARIAYSVEGWVGIDGVFETLSAFAVSWRRVPRRFRAS